jgi:hypothetical protein
VAASTSFRPGDLIVGFNSMRPTTPLRLAVSNPSVNQP